MREGGREGGEVERGREGKGGTGKGKGGTGKGKGGTEEERKMERGWGRGERSEGEILVKTNKMHYGSIMSP